MRALERSELRAIRDNSGRWQIMPEALSDWMSMRPVRSDDRQSPQVITDTADAVRIAVLETKLEAAETRVNELTRERDEARSDARQQADMLRATLDDMRRRPTPTLLERIRSVFNSKPWGV